MFIYLYSTVQGGNTLHINLIGISVNMCVDLNFEKMSRPYPCVQGCEKSMGRGVGDFFLVISCKVFTYYDNITDNFSLKLIRS